MRRRRFKILFGLILAGLVISILFLVFEHLRGRISLDHYLQGLAAKGEKLSLAELHPPVPADQNGAPEIFAAARQIQEHGMVPKPMPLRMELLPSGRAIVGFRETQWSAEPTNYWTRLATELKVNEEPLARIRADLNKPFLNNQLDYSEGFYLPLEHLASARLLNYWFGARTQLALHEGHETEALDDLLVQLRLPRLVAEDHLLISELVRIAMIGLARNGTWEALQADRWTDEDLARLQAAWEMQEFGTTLAGSLEGEVVYEESSYDLLRASNEETAQLFYGPGDVPSETDPDRPAWERCLAKIPFGNEVTGFLKRQVYCRIWRFAWSYQDEQRSLEKIQGLIEILRAGKDRKSWVDLKPAVIHFEKEWANKSRYDEWCYPDFGFQSSSVVEKAMRAETERSLVLAAIAIKRYSLRHGRAPSTLAALVPDVLTSVPVDYMDGQPIRYRAGKDGNFTLYSVGANGQDDGGDASLLSGGSSPHNLWDRRDFVWPSPASAEETEAFRADAAKN